MNIAVFPGSFDPVTNGHLNIIARASNIFDELHVMICDNCLKKALLTLEEKEILINDAVSNFKNVKVIIYSGLLAKYTSDNNAILIKGIRSSTDFNYEYELFEINREISKDYSKIQTDTFFLPCAKEFIHISSTMVREMIKYNSPYDKFVPNAKLLSKILLSKQ